MNIRNLFKRPHKFKPDLVFKGHSFYILDPNAAKGTARELKYGRAQLFLNKLYIVQMNITEDDIRNHTAATTEAYNKKDYQRMELLNQTLIARLKLRGYEESYIQLGLTCIVIDDEKQPDARYTNLKRDLINSSVELHDFFLLTAYKFSNPSATSTDGLEMIEYFKKADYKIVIEILQKLTSTGQNLNTANN